MRCVGAHLIEVIMSEPVTETRAHEQALVMIVKKRALDDSATRRLTDEVLSAAGQTPALPIVLDMTHVKFAPSVALGALVQLSKSFKLDGRRLALIGVDSNLLSSIRVTNLHTLLEICNSIDAVINKNR
jgi:anti-anti-sigma factor